MKPLGLLVLFNVIAITGYFTFFGNADTKRVLTFATIGIFAALALLLADRITGVKVAGIGEISAATHRAVASAERIEGIEKEIIAHRDSIGMIVRDANAAREEITKVSEAAQKAEAKAKDAEKLVKSAQHAVDEIRDITEYSFLATKAENDDRRAFDRLIQIANDPKSKFQQYALTTLVKIANDPQVIGMIQTNNVDWEAINVDPKIASWEQLKTIFLESRISPLWRPSVLEAIWSEERFPLVQRIDFLCQVIKDDKSIRSAATACRLLDNEAKQKKNLLGSSTYLAWWNANRSKYEATSSK